MHTPHAAHAPDPAARRGFFDRIAPGWDARVANERFLTRLGEAVAALGIGDGERVVDLGCGTGNLTRLLLERSGDDARVLAVDFSEAMLETARRKLPADHRLTWLRADAGALPLAGASVDRVVCFSAWPHFPDGAAVSREISRVLRPGGAFHVLHVDSRETINRIHHHAGGPVAHDLLPPANELARLLEGAGLRPTETLDADDRYLVSAAR